MLRACLCAFSTTRPVDHQQARLNGSFLKTNENASRSAVAPKHKKQLSRTHKAPPKGTVDSTLHVASERRAAQEDETSEQLTKLRVGSSRVFPKEGGFRV